MADVIRAALAAKPTFIASEPSDEDLADLAEVFNGDPLPAMRRALELWGRPTVAALAAEPPAPAEPDTDAVLALAAIIRQVDGSHSLGAAALAEAILSHPGVAFSVLPPAPAPADHVPDAGNMVAADGEAEELAQWLEDEAVYYEGLSTEASAKATRAAALLRQPAPAPVPGWQPISTAPQDGTEILASDYDVAEILSWSWDAWETGSGWIDRNGQRLYPAWWQPLPDHPPHANTTHPTPTEPPTDD